MANSPYTNLDFSDVKNSLKEYMKGQSKFKDYDFEGSNMNVLLDVLAYNSFMNGIYANMAISEMFLDSAQLKDSVVSHSKELNYLPNSRKSARATIDISLSVAGSPLFVVIPENTQFLAKCGSKTYTFITEKSVEVTAINGVYRYSGLLIYEGTRKTELYKVDGTTTNRYVINDPNVDIDSIRVYVRESQSAVTKTEYIFKQNLFGVSTDDHVFYVQAQIGDKYEVTFGKDMFGVEPINGNIVEIVYRSTSGEEANGASSFSAASPIQGYTAYVTLAKDADGTPIKADGGQERETIESIKFFAPKSIQIQERAITETDYEILLRSRFPEIQAVSVYGGEELSPPRYGRVVIAVDVKNAYGVSENNKAKYSTYLKERCPIGIEPIITTPKFMYLSVTSDVYYDISTTEKTETDIKTTILSMINSYSDKNLSDFKKVFRFSKFISNIDNADPNIISNETSVLAIIGINPIIGQKHTETIKFNNALKADIPMDGNSGFYKPALQSSTFAYNGVGNAYIRDDGYGKLQIVKKESDKVVYLNRDVGKIDYATGELTVRNLIADSYTGSEISLYATTVLSDITPPKDRIMSIRPADVYLTVHGVKN